jgi:UPF0176 protein
MKNRGFKEVYQIDGGIVRYGEEFRDKGLWEGSLYVFDRRLKIEFSDDAKVLGTCNLCSAPTAQFHNCSNLACHKLTLVCGACEAASPTISCEDCREQE